jgi:glycosyltransferase involved in cell wall biosynthesis
MKTFEESFRWLASARFGRIFFPFAGTDEVRVIFGGFAHLSSKKNNYDLIYVSKPWLRSAGLGLMLGRRFGIPVVLDMDDYDISKDSYLLGRFDGIVVASRELQRLFKPYSPLYLPNSTDLDVFDPTRFPPRASNKCTIVWSGIMYDYIQLECLIFALRQMKEDALIFFSGDGPKKEKLVRLAKSLGVEQKTVFSEWGKKSAVPQRLAMADIGVVYTSETQFDLCKCPGKLFEYMAMKLPVVTTCVGEAGYTVRETGCGLEVPPNDPGALASAFDYLIRNPAERKIMGLRGRDYLLEKQNFSILGSRLDSFFSNVSSRYSEVPKHPVAQTS